MARKQIGKVGVQGAAGLACPRCGSTQFVAKRSKKGKVIGVATVGVGVVAAPKSQVKCVACGAMYKRGGRADTVPAVQAAPPPQVAIQQAPAQNVPPPTPAGHAQAAGWYADPTGRHELRWWGGVSWMDAVMDGGHQSDDPG